MVTDSTMHLATGKPRHLSRRLRRAGFAWRRLVHHHAETNQRLTKVEREQYAAVHQQLVTVCNELVRQEVGTERQPQKSGQLNQHSGAKGDRVLQASEALTSRVAEKERRSEMIHQLIELLRPWGNPKAVHDTPQTIVDDLLAQQRSLEARITGTSLHGSQTWLRPLVFAIVAALTAGVAFLLLMDLADGNVLVWSRRVLYTGLNRIAMASAAEKMLAGTGLCWIVGTFILWSAFRR